MAEDKLKFLFLQYLQNKCSRAEMDEFFLLIKKSKTDEHLQQLIRKVYLEIKHDYPSLTYVDSEGNLLLNQADDEPVPSGFIRIRTSKIKRHIVLVSISVAIIAFLWLTHKTEKPAVIASIESVTKKFTERKEQKFLLLSDSTQVWLNASSTLQFPDKFRKDEREVYLKGEAYFDVKHADKVPFLIHTGQVTTTVLGTAFNIKAYQDQKEIIVSVTRGHVEVYKNNAFVASLVKGQVVHINRVTEKVIRKEHPAETFAGWQQGKLDYDEMALDDILKDLENVYNVPIGVNDSATGNINITTAFNRDIGAENALQILARLTGKKVSKHNGKLILE